MQVRAAAARDLDRVAALASRLFAQQRGPGFALVPGRETELRELIAGLARDPRCALLVAEDEAGGLLGLVLASLLSRPGPFAERERGEIDWLFVGEDDRRHGVGRVLVGAALRWLREHGARRSLVHVERGNAAGRAFWNAQGFSVVMDVLERPL